MPLEGKSYDSTHSPLAGLVPSDATVICDKQGGFWLVSRSNNQLITFLVPSGLKPGYYPDWDSLPMVVLQVSLLPGAKSIHLT